MDLRNACTSGLATSGRFGGIGDRSGGLPGRISGSWNKVPCLLHTNDISGSRRPPCFSAHAQGCRCLAHDISSRMHFGLWLPIDHAHLPELHVD